jgi:hypothetical protein
MLGFEPKKVATSVLAVNSVANLEIESGSGISNKSEEKKRTSGTLIQKINSFFPFLWVIFALLDPDPDRESGFTTLAVRRSNHWNKSHAQNIILIVLRFRTRT